VSACWDQRREQINALDRVQQNVVQFTVHIKESDGETVAERRTIALLCALLKAFCGERAWNVIGDRLRGACYLSGVDHVRKITERKQRTDIGMYSFINSTIKNLNQLPA